jgi:cytochrome P450 family 6
MIEIKRHEALHLMIICFQNVVEFLNNIYVNCSTVPVMGLLFQSYCLQWLAIAVVLITSVWYYCVYKYSFWKKKGVKFMKPRFPFGNMRDAILLRKPATEVIKKLYDEFPEEPYFGTYQFFSPILLIRDPELIKQVMVKDFSYCQV